MLVLAAAAAVLGYNLPLQIPIQALLITFLALYLVLNLLDQEPGWNLAFLLAFFFTAGPLFRWLGIEVKRWETWLSFLGLVLTSFIAALVLGRRMRFGLKFLPFLTVFYLLFWVVCIFWALPALVLKIGLIFGLLLFSVSTASVLGKSRGISQGESVVPLAIELGVILINLFWLCGWIPWAN